MYRSVGVGPRSAQVSPVIGCSRRGREVPPSAERCRIFLLFYANPFFLDCEMFPAGSVLVTPVGFGSRAFLSPIEAHMAWSPAGQYIEGMDPLERIVVDPAVRFGKPTVRGTRLTVGEILGYLAAGRSEEGLLREFPQITHQDVLACLAFAAERERRTLSLPT